MNDMSPAIPRAELLPADAVDQVEHIGHRRVSHDELMVAQDALGRARDLELAAGNVARGREINQLVLACFMAAIRVEDLEFPDGAS